MFFSLLLTSSQKFINYFSDGLRKEYGSKGITVQVRIHRWTAEGSGREVVAQMEWS